MTDDYLWDPKAPRDPELARLEETLRPLRAAPPALSFDSITVGKPRRRRLALTAAAVVLLAGGYATARMMVEPWAVRALAGTATVDRARIDASAGIDARISEGQWLETDSASHAEINVGRIGRAVFGPGSRVQLVRAEAREHRLALARGTMHARIWAPPRFFLVQTANALAVDLGCVYSLSVDDQGRGELSVESGEVELIEGTRRALVPAGNTVSMRPGFGPGLPIRTTATERFRSAVHALESDPADGAALRRVLALATSESSITLWHLLQRVSPDQRERVYVRLIELVPAPEGVATPALLALDRRAMRQWKEELQDDWTIESVPKWKRAWRKAWTLALTLG